MEADPRIDSGSTFGDLEGKRRLAGLPRPEQRNGRSFGQCGFELGQEPARNHVCISGVALQKCKFHGRPDTIQLKAKMGRSIQTAVYPPSTM